MPTTATLTSSLTRPVTQGLFGSGFTNEYSVLFDGASDYATSGADSTLATVTYSWWMKSTQSGNSGIFDHGGTTKGAFSCNRWASTKVLWQRGSSTNYVYFVGDLSSTAPQDGVWHHWLLYAATAITDTELFIDGVEQTAQVTGTGTSGAQAYSTGIRLGQISGVRFPGNLDEFAIFGSGAMASSLLSPLIYNSGSPTDLSSLSPLHWFRMGDGDSGSTVIDHGSGGANMTLVHSPPFVLDTP